MMRGQSQNVCIKSEKIFVSIENIAEMMGGSHRDHQQYYGQCGQLSQWPGATCDVSGARADHWPVNCQVA